ncbi:hypothetical protein QCA50_018007 [Cerrena zonata]|uniref:Uncharacterized protein n=1 Tax=Cerrena zonata TaxID=2478898 RepID=A0AAW0FE28_9APHY
MHRVATVLLVLSLLLISRPSFADGLNNTFLWGFNATMDHFPACSSVTMFVEALPSSQITDPLAVTVPPYTMYAFESGGTPRTQNIGSDPHNLTWVVDHSPGTQLMLIVLDSVNNTGGLPSQFFDVIDGSTDCLPTNPNPTSAPSISSNVTNGLETCQLWGLRISNGIQPYTVVLSALGADVVTIIAMQLGNSVLTYPNRASPGTQLIASVYDSTGTWGMSTKPVFTFGSSNTTCPGLETSQSNSSPAKSNNRVLKIVLGIIPAAIFILTFLAIGFWWRRHRRRQRIEQPQGTWDPQLDQNQDYTVSPYVANRPHVEREMETNGATATPYLRKSPLPRSTATYSETMTAIDSPESNEEQQTGGAYYASYTGTSPPSAAGSHSNIYFTGGTSDEEHYPLQRASKSLGGHSELSSSPHVVEPFQPGYLSPSLYLPPGASPPVTPGLDPNAIAPSRNPSIIIQHVDGGSGGVQEIPPPYADRSTSATDVESNERS